MVAKRTPGLYMGRWLICRLIEVQATNNSVVFYNNSKEPASGLLHIL